MTGAAHLKHVDFQNIDFFILTTKSKQTGSLRSGSFKARSLYHTVFNDKSKIFENLRHKPRDERASKTVSTFKFSQKFGSKFLRYHSKSS